LDWEGERVEYVGRFAMIVLNEKFEKEDGAVPSSETSEKPIGIN